MPDARVVIIASIAHTLVVERSCQFSLSPPKGENNTNAMTGSAADWVGYILYKIPFLQFFRFSRELTLGARLI